jgi:uncharacterized membrane protein
MTYMQLTYAHLVTVVPAFLIGSWLLLRRKGTSHHRELGRIYLALMLLTGITTLFMPAGVGPRFLGHFGYLHLLSVFTLVTVVRAFHAARTHQVALHRNNMIGLYCGGILIAGSFALMPGRLLHGWLFGA